MVVIWSSPNTANMSVSQEISDYFSESVKPLTTYELLEYMFKMLKEEIVSKFEGNCNEKK